MSVTTGSSMCGMRSNGASSTTLGSTMMSRRSSGVRRWSSEATMTLSPTLLPAPVAPATSRWGIAARSS